MDNPMSLENHVVLVTGAAQGIGRAVATRAAALGARVALVDINGDGVRDTAAALGSDHEVHVGSVADP